MANEGTTQKAPRAGQNRIFILLLVFAAISSVSKDLDRLHALTTHIHGFTSSWMQLGSTVYASEIGPVADSCPEAPAQD